MTRQPAETDAIIAVSNLTHRYGAVLALADVSLIIPRGSFIGLFGPNGAGKSTLTLLMSGQLKPTAGQVAMTRTTKVALIPEGRRLFGQLSVHENLILGGYGMGASKSEIKARMEKVLVHMPKSIREAMKRSAATLSGGERQILALGRALMAEPDIIIADEPSLGLAPVLIDRTYEILQTLNDAGTTILVSEQMATHALGFTQSMYVLDRGRIAYSGTTSGDAADRALRAGYVGEPT